MKQGRAMLTVAVSLAALMMLTPVRADDRAVRQELERLYAQWHRAAQASNPANKNRPIREFIERRTTRDFTARSGKQVENRMIVLDQLQSAGEASLATVSTRIDRLTVKGTEAIALTTTRTVERGKWAPGVKSTDRMHETITTVTGRDIWKKTPEGWKLRVQEIRTVGMTVDGKTVPLDSPGRRRPSP